MARRESGFSPDEFNDLKQELLLATLGAVKHYQPDRGTFAALLDRVLRNRAVEIGRRKNTAKRDWRRNWPSLQQPLRGRDAVGPVESPFSESIEDRDARAHTGRTTRTDEKNPLSNLTSKL